MTNEQVIDMLLQGAKENDLNKVTSALNLGADVNAKDENGNTLLHYSAFYGFFELAQLSLANKADTNVKSENGLTPLHAASLNNNLPIAQILLANGAEVNAKANGEYIPLHMTAIGDSLEMAKFLLEYGADANAKNEDGQTPYDYAESEEMEALLQEVMTRQRKK